MNAIDQYSEQSLNPLLEYAENEHRLSEMSAGELAGLYERLTHPVIQDVERVIREHLAAE